MVDAYRIVFFSYFFPSYRHQGVPGVSTPEVGIGVCMILPADRHMSRQTAH